MMSLTPFHLGSLLALLHLLGILAAAHAILTVRTSQGAVAWAVSLLAAPYFTLIPYLILGRSKFSGYVEARRQQNRVMHSRVGEIDWHAGQASALRQDIGFSALTRLTGMPFTANNGVRLLVNGDATFAAIFDALRQARSYIIVQFFIVHDDALGRELQQILLERAAAGIKVYFLYDSIGSYDLPAQYTETLRAGGVRAHAFATQRGLIKRFLNRFQLNFRNHRKIVVIDGDRAFIGGHNVGVEYLGQNPPLSPWRDTHIDITGPAVIGIQRAFVEDWHWATGEIPAVKRVPAPSGARMHCQVVPSGPADKLETCSLFFVECINAAQQRVWITTPYFIPDEAVFSALRLAVLRGVDVRLLIPSRRDHYVVFEATTLYAYDAVRAGIQVYQYQPGFVHQKVVLIDDAAAAVGSANLDNRSFRLNFEIMLLTVDDVFAGDVERMLDTDFAQARPMTRDAYYRLPFWRRIAMHVARLFAPIL